MSFTFLMEKDFEQTILSWNWDFHKMNIFWAAKNLFLDFWWKLSSSRLSLPGQLSYMQVVSTWAALPCHVCTVTPTALPSHVGNRAVWGNMGSCSPVSWQVESAWNMCSQWLQQQKGHSALGAEAEEFTEPNRLYKHGYRALWTAKKSVEMVTKRQLCASLGLPQAKQCSLP